jgi:hypothetical protein
VHYGENDRGVEELEDGQLVDVSDAQLCLRVAALDFTELPQDDWHSGIYDGDDGHRGERFVGERIRHPVTVDLHFDRFKLFSVQYFFGVTFEEEDAHKGD